MSFDPSLFFDLKPFAWSELFSECEHVWDVIPKIGDFLKTMPSGKILSPIPQGVTLVNEETIYIEEGVNIEAGAWIQGPCFIGKGSSVRQGAYIRGNLITGEGCVIGHATEVKNAVFLNGAKAAHFAYVGDSLLGNEVNLGAGTKLANLKLDNRPVRLYHEGRHVDTGLRKFGAVVGDFSQTGCNSVTNPGTLFGKNAGCYPCVVVSGYIPSGEIVKKTKMI